jgi:hypothetical protein
MTVEEQHTGASLDAYRDLRLALHTAASLQATIRHADSKAKILLGVQGGMAVVVLQQTSAFGGVETPALIAVAGIVAIAWVTGLAIAGWHLLATIAPRLVWPHGANRFAFPATRPTTDGIRDLRDEAWDLVSALADIALAKHSRVRRSLPALIVASASAGAFLALAITVGITT